MSSFSVAKRTPVALPAIQLETLVETIRAKARPETEPRGTFPIAR
jgi:hypothetical protein